MNESTRNDAGDVLIVGGGLAGVASAIGLLGKGYEVTVVERDERLGGRARSWRDETTGDPVHIGPHILLSEYPNFFRLLDTLGTRNRVVWQEDRFVTIVEGQKKYPKRQSNWLPAPFIYLPSELRDDAYTQQDILSNLPILTYALQLDEDDINRLDNMNAYALLKMMGVSEKFIDSVWRFTCRAIMNMPLEYCSAGALMNFYRYFIGYGDYQVGFPREGLGELFAPDAADYIRNHENGTLRLESDVEALLRDGDRVDGVRLSDGTQLRADRTVVGLTVPKLRTLLPADWRREYTYFSDLGFFEPCKYISPYLWFDRKLTDLKFWARRYDYADLNCDFYDLSNISDRVNNGNSLITSNIIYSNRLGDWSDEEIIQETLRELSEFIPEAKDAQLKHSVVNRVPLAIHCPYPGTHQRRPDPDSPIEGLYLAGDWVATGLPSSMESATKAGWMVADRIVQDDNGSSSFTQPIREVEGVARLIRDMGQWKPLKRIRKWVPPLLDN